MSTSVIVPPSDRSSNPSSSSWLRHVPRLTARTRGMLTAMNLHFAGVAALVVLDLYLAAHLLFVWQGLNALNDTALEQQAAQLRAAEIAAKPLRGLDTKLVDSTQAADAFYRARLPYATSQVAAELGALTQREGVHLTRVQYAYSPVLSGSDALTEMRMDAGISGDYRPVVQFLNAAERDRLFFVITGINLTGQQTGQVNLRIRLTTYLRAPQGNEMVQDLPVAAGGTP